MFGSPSFVGLSILTLLVYGVLGGLLILLPYVLIRSGGYSAAQAGAALLPFPALMAIGSPLVGGLAGRFGARLPLAVGSLIMGAGLLLTLSIRTGGGYWTSVVPSLVVVALGMAAVAAPLTTSVLASVDTEHEGSASGLNSALARAGGLIAIALLGAVLASRGQALVAGFHVAALVGAGCCACAAACAFALVRSRS
jgi:predicted MFS family arabinose efflux permease